MQPHISSAIIGRQITLLVHSKEVFFIALGIMAITLAILDGASVENVRDFAGHKSIATTSRYIHGLNKWDNHVSDKIDIGL